MAAIMAADITPLVSVRDVTFSYGYDQVLKNISLDIYPQDYLAIIGPNGGGKTTLLKIILGLLKPDSGEIHWSGVSGKGNQQGIRLVMCRSLQLLRGSSRYL
jgi:ABC-type Mn2+/Zn2+ transport system ATPase subunit